MSRNFKIFLIVLAISAASFLSGSLLSNPIQKLLSQRIIETDALPTPKPLEVYTIDNLSKITFAKNKIETVSTMAEEAEFTSYLFKMNFSPNPDKKEIKHTGGVINIPKSDTDTKFPLVLMLRGYVDQKIYTPGTGSKRAAEVFAKNGYITIAPDFLGYADSSQESSNIFESRFQTYTTTLNILSSLDSIGSWDNKNIFIWGHSNGGQIALTILEITGALYPTTLWAPVSKPFPYSILYYTDESEDKGKFIRKQLSVFEDDYDVEKYSITNYIDRIKASIQIHQGTLDDAVPVEWTNSLQKTLKNQENKINYFTYLGADHNLQPSWNTVVERDLDYFQDNLLE